MRKNTVICLLALSLLMVLGAGSVAEKTLDKASPKLTNRVEGSLLSKESVFKEY